VVRDEQGVYAIQCEGLPCTRGPVRLPIGDISGESRDVLPDPLETRG
jgi:hypothetical protein